MICERCEQYKKAYDAILDDCRILESKIFRLAEEVNSVADSLFPGPLCAKLKAAVDAIKKE